MPAYQLDNGKWVCAFYYRNAAGELKRKYKRSFDSEAEALEYEEHFKDMEGTPGQMTFAEMVKSDLHEIKPRIRWLHLRHQRAHDPPQDHSLFRGQACKRNNPA